MFYYKFTFLVAITIIEGIEMVENTGVEEWQKKTQYEGKTGLLMPQCFLVHVSNNRDTFHILIFISLV